MASFIRVIRVRVGRLETTNHYVTFSIRRRSDDTQANGAIRIYNLSKTNEERISERGLPVVLFAGYERPQSDITEIFRGDVVRFERQRIGNDRISVVHVGNEVLRQNTVVLNRTFRGPTSVRQIVRDLVRELGLPHGPIDDIPDITRFEDFPANGPVIDSLRTILKDANVRFYIDGGVVYFTSPGRPTRGPRLRFVISQESGMVGTPTVTDDGIRIRTLLDHRIYLGATVRVVSLGESVGEYKVVEIEHSGDNRQGEFISLIEGRPL